MRTRNDIRQRIRGLIVQELDRRIAEARKRLPHLCTHNYRHHLDTRKTIDGDANDGYNCITRGRSLPVVQSIGLCMLGAEDPEQWGGTICEDPIDAQGCPYFTPTRDKAVILAELKEQLFLPGWVEENLPDVANLLWALDEVRVPQIPWWKALWYRWVLRINVEPIRPKSSVNLLLAGTEGSDEGLSS